MCIRCAQKVCMCVHGRVHMSAPVCEVLWAEAVTPHPQTHECVFYGCLPPEDKSVNVRMSKG